MPVFDVNKTYVTIGAVGSALVAAVVGTWYVANRINDLAVSIADLKREIQEMRDGSVTVAKAAELALRMALENPSLRVPDPRSPDRVLQAIRPSQ